MIVRGLKSTRRCCRGNAYPPMPEWHYGYTGIAGISDWQNNQNPLVHQGSHHCAIQVATETYLAQDVFNSFDPKRAAFR